MSARDAGEERAGARRSERPTRRRGARSAAEGRARRTLGGGGLLLVAGLALVGVGPSDAGMALTLLALALLIYGIHSFGRLGPERDERARAPSP
ncbi:hypothetical protein WMF37_35035 [Sorangium sp. So ce291]|uniref:hypothetical protein n=1 Tax=Sorangium sp. So ce291 TaxID=3133294 RepID=UPI003F620695